MYGMRLHLGFALLGLVIGITQASFARANDFLSLKEHLDKASSNSARYLVKLKSAPNLLGKNKRTLDGSVQQKQFEQKQNELLTRLHVSDGRVISKFKHVPMMSLRLTESQLATVFADPELEIFADRIHRPQLASSVPIVYSTQNTSVYHGDNRWAVAVLDSGVDKSHPMLQTKVISEACFSTTDGLASATSLCPDGDDVDTLPDQTSTSLGSGVPCVGIVGCAHGTQIAGVIAGNDNGVEGVARDANIISIQVYSQIDDEITCFPDTKCLGAFDSDIIAALDHVLSLNSSLDIAAVNLSLGFLPASPPSGTCDTQPEKPSIDALRAAGVPVVIPTGNDGLTQGMRIPACISTAIAVASTNDIDQPSTNNNINAALDLFAPGENILSPAPGNGYLSGTGTSFASAHVAGAWAVAKNKWPSATVDELEALFKTTGVDVSQHGETRKRINLDAVLAQIPEPIIDEFCLPIRAQNGNIAVICL